MRGYPEELRPLAGSCCPVRGCGGKVSFGFVTDDATHDQQAVLLCALNLSHAWHREDYFRDDSVFGVGTPSKDGRTPTVTGKAT